MLQEKDDSSEVIDELKRTTLFLIMDSHSIYDGDFKKIVKNVISKNDLKQRIKDGPNHLERMNTLNQEFCQEELLNFTKLVYGELKKSNTIASIFIEMGNMFQKDSNMNKALRAYNLAASFAHQASECIGLVYVARAKLLLKLNKPEACLQDIEMALLCNLNENIKSELITNKLNCQKYHIENNKISTTIDDDENIQRKIFKNEVLFQIAEPRNTKLPSGSECVSIYSNKDIGRHLVSNKIVSPGTTVMVEDPYVITLDDIFLWNMKHCCKCLKMISSTIPCTTCIFVTYCSEDCRQQDTEHRKYECILLPFCHSIDVDINIYLGLKAICKAGPEILYKIYLNSTLLDTNKYGIAKGENIDGKYIYESDSYYQICNLASHINLKRMGLKACIGFCLGLILEWKTNFFDNMNLNTIEKKSFRLFVSSFLLRHIFSFKYNTMSLSENIYKKIETTTNSATTTTTTIEIYNNYDFKEFATALYPLISLMSHGCYPNAIVQNTIDGKMAIITNRELKCGDEFLISYGYWFTIHEIKSRQENLRKYYHFKCTCIACTCKWPLYKNLMSSSSENEFICSNCNSLLKPIPNDEHGNKLLKCEICKFKFDSKILNIKLKKYESKYFKALSLIESNKILDAIPIIQKCIQYFVKNTHSPSTRQLACEELLEKIYRIIVEEY